jgi:eukaryotic-like serine/threonine-protein kinase
MHPVRRARPEPPQVAPRYEMVREIGRGGCAVVYEARDRNLDRLVAIKVLQSRGTDAAAAERLSREARVAAAIHHPNVCAVTDAGRLADGRPFIVMERLYGETLRDYVGRVGRLDPDEMIDIALQLLSGLESVHTLGIVHRDVKPDNVFLVQRSGCFPHAKLLDFGLCRRATVSKLDDKTLTRAGTVVGTPEYMAPEQVSGARDFDARIDLYAVGVLMWEAMTGLRAFAADDVRAVLVSVLAKPLPPLRKSRPDVPSVLDRIVTRAIERNPRARYWNAGDFLADLNEARSKLMAAYAIDESGEISSAAGEWDMPTVRVVPRRRSA